jgi:hypothetical protein
VAREGGRRVADWWGRAVSGGAGARSWAAWSGERGGGVRAHGAGWAGFGPAKGGKVYPFLFLVSISFLFLFYFCFFLFLFPLNQKFSK